MYVRRLLPLALVLPLFALCAQKGGIAPASATVGAEAPVRGVLDNKAGAAEDVRPRAPRFNLRLTQVAGSVWIVYADPEMAVSRCAARDREARPPAQPAANASPREWLLWLWLTTTGTEVCW